MALQQRFFRRPRPPKKSDEFYTVRSNDCISPFYRKDTEKDEQISAKENLTSTPDPTPSLSDDFNDEQNEGNQLKEKTFLTVEDYDPKWLLRSSDPKRTPKHGGPAGPEPFPSRKPKQRFDMPQRYIYMDENDMRPMPLFTLSDFINTVAEKHNVSYATATGAILSRQNYKKLTKILADCIFNEKNFELRSWEIHLDSHIKTPQPRIPKQQLLIEMASMLKEYMLKTQQTITKPVIRKLPKFSPNQQIGVAPHSEIILVEQEKPQDTNATHFQHFKRSFSPLMPQQNSPLGEKDLQFSPSVDEPWRRVMLFGGQPNYFQDSCRNKEPFVPSQNESKLSYSESAILDAMFHGGVALSLKAHFTDYLPSVFGMTDSLIYLNLSFNNFLEIPKQVFMLRNLQILKLRNNPISAVPKEISLLGRTLRVLVLAFCLIESKNISNEMWLLTSLRFLDLSFNRLSELSSDIRNLRSLRELNLEGNQLPALPGSAVQLNLKRLRVVNNYMDAVFWKETSKTRIQKLSDLSASFIVREKLHERLSLPEKIVRYLSTASSGKCDMCHGLRYGNGWRILKPCSQLFGVKNLPFLFYFCSHECAYIFRGSVRKITDLRLDDEPQKCS